MRSSCETDATRSSRAQCLLLRGDVARDEHAAGVGPPVIEQPTGGERQRDAPPLGILRPHGLVLEAFAAARPRQRMVVRVERRLAVLLQQHPGLARGVQSGHGSAETSDGVVLVDDVAADREAHHAEVDGVEHLGDQLLLLHGGGAREGEARGLRVEEVSLRREATRRGVHRAADRDDDEGQEEGREAEHRLRAQRDQRPVQRRDEHAARDEPGTRERGEPHRREHPEQPEPPDGIGLAHQRDRDDVDERQHGDPAGGNARPRHGERGDAAEADEESAEREQLGAMDEAAYETDDEQHRDDRAQQQLVGRRGAVAQVESLPVAPRTLLRGERGAVGGRPLETLHNTDVIAPHQCYPSTPVPSRRTKSDRGRGPKATTPVRRMLRISDPRASRAEPRAPRRRRGCRHRRGRR